MELRDRLVTVTRLEHAEALALERIREELLDGILVVDEEDGGGVGHLGYVPAVPSWCDRPTIAPAWPPFRLAQRGAGRDPARSNDRSTAGSTAAPG